MKTVIIFSHTPLPLSENYSNLSFDKSKGLNNQEVEKMKSICSNHIFKPTLSNHFLQIDLDLIEKLIPCSLQGGPFGAPACPPVFVILGKHCTPFEKSLTFTANLFLTLSRVITRQDLISKDF